MTINCIVVLMLENRSYDNVLGGLYLHQTPPPGQAHLLGLTGKEINRNAEGIPIPVHPTVEGPLLNGVAYPPTCVPLMDPGELFGDMAQQYVHPHKMPAANPYTDYSPTPFFMEGFVTNYAAQDPAPPLANTGEVMSYLTPEQMPVTAFLARHYAICDEWFASAPTQTFTNRTFALLAGPAYQTTDDATYAWVDDAQWSGYKNIAMPTSIFKELDVLLNGGTASPSDWKVYFHDFPISCICDIWVMESVFAGIEEKTNENVAVFDSNPSEWGNAQPFFTPATPTFVADALGGTLPKLSLIEPRYFSNSNGLAPNSNHPGLGNLAGGVPSTASELLPPESAVNNVPIDAASGELLLMQVYNILRASPQWDEMLFIVTYDEPGGMYDHIAPRIATPPGGVFPAAQNPDDPAANGFGFNVFGGRVPAIIIGPRIKPGATIRATTPFDHTSIIRTALDQFAPKTKVSLTSRDAAAPSLRPFFHHENSTGAFSGQIICGPSAVVILGTGNAIVCASAGKTELTATMNDQPSWVTSFNTSWSGAWSSTTDLTPYTLTVTLAIDATGITSAQQTSFTISGTGLTTVTVPVTLAPS